MSLIIPTSARSFRRAVARTGGRCHRYGGSSGGARYLFHPHQIRIEARRHARNHVAQFLPSAPYVARRHVQQCGVETKLCTYPKRVSP